MVRFRWEIETFQHHNRCGNVPFATTLLKILITQIPAAFFAFEACRTSDFMVPIEIVVFRNGSHEKSVIIVYSLLSFIALFRAKLFSSHSEC